MSHPIVQVCQGALCGLYDTTINGSSFVAFKGIPYAKAPIGKLRFRDPQPPEPWSGVRDAIKFSDICAQSCKTVSTGVVGSDDCLYLNVYTTTLQCVKPRAVMVWIHGGAFTHGCGDDDTYGPDYLIEKDVVLVTINYRVGILGFLNVEDEVASGNQGLKDQVQALKWIQQNIKCFGGDANNVTIFGCSAGGASVHYLTISSLAQGLFHKAIIQSGVANNPWASVMRPAINSAQKLAKLLNKDISDVKKFIDYLQTLDVARLIEIEYQLSTVMERALYLNPFSPSVDKNAKKPFLPITVEEAIKNGIKVPCIIGHVTHEGIIIAAAFNDEHIAQVNDDRGNLLLPEIVMKRLEANQLTANDVYNIYLGNEKISKCDLSKVVDLLTTTSIVMGIHDVIEVQAKTPSVPMYFYKLIAHTEDTLIQKQLNTNLKGTCHGEECSLLFYPKLYETMGRKSAEPDSAEFNLIERFTELWTNFAKTGNPCAKISELTPVLWRPIDKPKEYNCLMITENLTMGIEQNILHKLNEKIKKKQ